jgi:hypothetical protein
MRGKQAACEHDRAAVTAFEQAISVVDPVPPPTHEPEAE